MSPDASVTHWINQLKEGDPDAAQRLWERYFHRLVGLARRKLEAMPRRVAADQEDVALSAFDSFFRRAGEGRFPRLDDRDNLWRLLVAITVRKARRLVRDEHRLKRGGGAVLGESALDEAGEAAPLEQVIGEEPTPLLAARAAEEYERLLARLGDAELRSIAVWKMEGDTNAEIARKLGCAPPTVERRLALIRRLWETEGPP